MQPAPADQDGFDVERRDIWCSCTGYLVAAADAPAFVKWAQTVDFWGRLMPEPHQIYRMYLGEHGWAPASQYFERQYAQDIGKTSGKEGCPVELRVVASQYIREAGDFDCAIDESYSFYLPTSELIKGLGLKWTGEGADFVGPAGKVVALDPRAHEDDLGALLLREEDLRQFLAKEKLTICWTVLGEKRVLGGSFGGRHHHPSLRMVGAYYLADEELQGEHRFIAEEPPKAVAKE